MRDYSTTPNGFRINSSSSVLLDDQQQQKSAKSVSENRATNGDVNNYRNNNGIVGTEFDAIATATNAATDTINEHHLHRHPFMNEMTSKTVIGQPKRTNYTLWIATPVAASFAVAIVLASIAGPQWLLTEEKIPNINYNGTSNYNVVDDGIYVTKYTKSSLWILCASQGINYYCSTIDYFPNEEYSPDPNDSTLAIPYAITRATPFFLLSAIVLLISYIILMTAMCSHQRSIYFFTSGIIFIISGLLMLIGLIMYIAIFKAEIGSKLRPRNPLQTPMFTFRYGQSFFLYVIGFISTEIVGVLNVFLFISLQQIGREKTIPCFLYQRTTPEKVKDLESNLKHLHMGFACKKHSKLPNGYFSPFTQRRYFFEKAQNCNVHAKNLAKSLNELYTEPAPSVSPFDVPPDFPLTRSVSTTTEIFSNNNSNDNKAKHQQQQSIHQTNDKNEEHKRSSRESLNDICGFTKSILSNKKTKSEDELFNEFCQRAGYRPKPKDIYVIENDGRDDQKDIIVVDNYSSLRKNRRNSATPSSIRKSNLFNTNTSLKDVNKSYPKSLFDLDSSDQRFLNNYFEQNNSRDRSIYQSRTLPRDFLKRNVEFSDESLTTRRVSASGVYQSPKDNYGDYYKKSYDALASRNSRHRDAYSGDDTMSIHWPMAIPASPSSFSTRSQFRIRSGNLCATNSHRRPASPGSDNEDFGTFDLDQIENERRKSHASLFKIDLNYDEGTPV